MHADNGLPSHPGVYGCKLHEAREDIGSRCMPVRGCPHLQFWTCSCKRPSRGGEGTSPKTWMTMTWTDIASGRSLDGTDQSTTAVLGACRH